MRKEENTQAKGFKLSSETANYLSIYQDVSEAASRLYEALTNSVGGSCDGGREERAEALFKPYGEHFEAIKAMLLKQVSCNIEWGLSGRGTTI